jgi:ABC-type nitrate/sulfonate/bicarbonate transport system substrate-binding protein
MNDCFPAYPGPVMAARRRWAQSHERELLAFIRAYDAAYAWLADASHASEARAMLPEHLATSDSAAAAALAKFASRSRPRLTPEGIEQVIDTYWNAERLTSPKGTPAKYMDLSYMDRALA